MGLIKGSVTLTRYQVSGDLPASGADFLDTRIREHCFRDIEQSTDEQSVGWVNMSDFMDTSFAYSAYSLEPYIILGFRVDKRRVPASLLRKYHRMEMDKAIKMREGRALGRADREQLKEKARLGLLARIPPDTKVYDVVWDTARAQVWLGSASKGVTDLFEDHFEKSFTMGLTPRLPFLLAGDLLEGESARQRLEAARPWEF
jgi:DNA recombination-dependent growth factor C